MSINIIQLSLLLTLEKSPISKRVCCKCFEGYTHKEENVMFFIVFDVGLLKYVKRECFIQIRT